MITIEVLRDIGFFNKIPALKNICSTHNLKAIYITPTIHLSKNKSDCYLAVEENDVQIENPVSSFLTALNEIQEVLKPLFEEHNLELKVFPIDTLELVEDDSDYYPIYQTALQSAIPLGILDQVLSLEMQWAIQSLSHAFNATQKPKNKSENAPSVILSSEENHTHGNEYFCDNENSEPETDTAQKRPAKKQKLGD